jgi:hypothetical protein
MRPAFVGRYFAVSVRVAGCERISINKVIGFAYLGREMQFQQVRGKLDAFKLQKVLYTTKER